MEIKITSNSSYLKEVEQGKSYLIQYGTLRKGQDTIVDIFITGADHLSHQKSCGCTTPSVEIQDGGFKLTIKYDNAKIGSINQFVKERVSINGEVKEIRFDLRGQIV